MTDLCCILSTNNFANNKLTWDCTSITNNFANTKLTWDCTSITNNFANNKLTWDCTSITVRLINKITDLGWAPYSPNSFNEALFLSYESKPSLRM